MAKLTWAWRNNESMHWVGYVPSVWRGSVVHLKTACNFTGGFNKFKDVEGIPETACPDCRTKAEEWYGKMKRTEQSFSRQGGDNRRRTP